MIFDVLLWGLAIGIVHFVVVGTLYANPLVARQYEKAKKSSGVKIWENQKEYLIKMFLGTQIEVYILTAAYLYLRQMFPSPTSFSTAVALAVVVTVVRVYPRFWNMWIQSTYPNNLLVIELLNGIIGTFVIVMGVWLLPIA